MMHRLVNQSLLMIQVMLVLSGIVFSTTALSHKVIFDAYVIDNSIEGELGFSNGEIGDFAEIQVLDTQNNLVDKIYTDADGFFAYLPHSHTDHRFYVDLGAGHIGNVLISTADLNDLSVVTDAEPTLLYKSSNSNQVDNIDFKRLQQMTVSISTEANLEALVTQVKRLQGEVKQLRKSINTYKESHSLQQVIGALGYILGLVGLWFYIAARTSLRKHADDNRR